MSSKPIWGRDDAEILQAQLETVPPMRECHGCGVLTVGERKNTPMCPRCAEEVDALREMREERERKRAEREKAKQRQEPWTVLDWLLLIFVLIVLSDLGWDFGRVIFGGGAQ